MERQNISFFLAVRLSSLAAFYSTICRILSNNTKRGKENNEILEKRIGAVGGVRADDGRGGLSETDAGDSAGVYGRSYFSQIDGPTNYGWKEE